MSKETVALDIDDVVVKHVEGFLKWTNKTYGTKLNIQDYSEAWYELWGIPKEEEEGRKKLFFTDEIVGAFEEVEGAREGLIALAATKRIIGVTSRRESLRDITSTVLEAMAPGTVEDVVFATYFVDGLKFTKSKAEICPELGASWLIDDHLKHCRAVAAVGVNAVLFGDYPWNACDEDLPGNITRASDWPETVAILNANSQVS